MKVVEIYKRYEIPRNLQLHMLRVAAVARLVLENTKVAVDKETVIQACLVHDLGNIVKFILDGKGLHVDEDLDSLRKVQQKFMRKYGVDDHEVTDKILKELGVSDRVKDLVYKLGFGPRILQEIADGEDVESKVVLYADSRVSPYGVLSVKERMGDLERRYVEVERIHNIKKETFEATKTPVLEVARQIEDLCGEVLKHLTDTDLEQYFAELLEYNIPTNDNS